MNARSLMVQAGLMLVCSALGAAIFAFGQAHFAPAAADGAAIRAYLLANPEVLPEAMERLQARENERMQKAQQSAQAAVPKLRGELTRPYAGAWAGNPRGDVTIVAFLDYACGYCRASLPGLNELLAKDPNVRVVYREFPVLGPESVVAARWALAAAEQGKFRTFHEALYAAGDLSEAGIRRAATKAGLDLSRAAVAARSPAVEAEIAKNHQFGQTLAISGTPSWVVGDTLLYGMRNYQGLAAAVAEARRGR